MNKSTAKADESATEWSPYDFFNENGGLLSRTLLDAVESLGPMATNQGGHLYRYKDGLWWEDGEREVIDRVRRLMDEKFRPAQSNNVLVSLKNRPPTIDDNAIDTDHLNLPNGLLNWRTGELLDHDPEIMALSRIPVEWDPDATCPVVDAWLREMLPEDCLELAYEIIGYALFNGNPLHKAVLLSGGGRNGKGTLQRLVEVLVGSENFVNVPPQELDENRFAAASLFGKLLNTVGEIDGRNFKQTETFKKATGEDHLRAEHKYAQPFRFKCRALIMCSFNELPRSNDTTAGFFSRWIVLPFNVKLAGREDPSVEEKLQDPAELQGLLVKAVAGLRRVMGRQRFDIPPSVEEAMQEFKSQADPVREFATDILRPDSRGWNSRSAVFTRWSSWARENNCTIGTRSDFYRRLLPAFEDVHGLKLEERRRQGTDGFKGISPLELNVKSSD